MLEAVAGGRADAWAEMVTDTFVGTSASGAFQTKGEKYAEIAARGRQAAPGIRQASIRVHGTFAVATLRTASEPDFDAWQTVVAVKNGTRWLIAATAMTPTTGAAR
jgi:hypothetical protein